MRRTVSRLHATDPQVLALLLAFMLELPLTLLLPKETTPRTLITPHIGMICPIHLDN